MDDVNQLIDQLKDSDACIRAEAATALGQTGDARAVQPLIDSWRDPDENVRGTALSAVSEIGLPAVGRSASVANEPSGAECQRMPIYHSSGSQDTVGHQVCNNLKGNLKGQFKVVERKDAFVYNP